MASDEASRSERYEAQIRRLMADRAALPATGGLAWQYRARRASLRLQIEHTFQAWDVARDIEGHEAEFDPAEAS